MEFSPTRIPDVILIHPNVFEDSRGFFMESYRTTEFAEKGIPDVFVQENHSASRQGVLRGLHYQIHQPQGKLVRVIAGEVFDVAVDIRRSSHTYGKWVSVNLSAANKLQLWVPRGFAHGFYVISEWAEILYKTTDFYAPQWERTLVWDDPNLAIDWPLLKNQPPLLSNKDAQGKQLSDAEIFN